MVADAYDQFSFELRQLRISNDFSRAALASLLGISSSTLKKWEDGKSRVRTYKLWEVYERLKVFEGQSKSQNIPFGALIEIFDALIERLEMANVSSDELLKREINRKLSKTILRTAQTDFGLSRDERSLVPVPFTEDLELFRNNRLIDIEQLLQSICSNVEDSVPHIEKANINSERLVETLLSYVDEIKKDIPNPRILHRKGEILRTQIQNQDVRSALSGWDINAHDGFVDDHQELMRLYFGEALLASYEVERAQMNDSIIPDAGVSSERLLLPLKAMICIEKLKTWSLMRGCQQFWRRLAAKFLTTNKTFSKLILPLLAVMRSGGSKIH